MPEVLNHPTSCPKCGKQLQVVALDWQTAPWLCNDCHRGFFTAELSGAARERYRPGRHDWGQGPFERELRESVAKELEEQQKLRGTSLRRDQLDRADKSVLEFLASHPRFAVGFTADIKATLARVS